MKTYRLLALCMLCWFTLWSCGSDGDTSKEKENSSVPSSEVGNGESSEDEGKEK